MGWFSNKEVSDLQDRLARIELGMWKLLRASQREEIRDIMAQKDIDDLKMAAQENKNAASAIKGVLDGLVAKLEAAGDDPEEIQAAIAEIKASTQVLTDAAVANTPAA